MTDDQPVIQTDGGWRVPADVFYNMLPEITARRGGISFTTPVWVPSRAEIVKAVNTKMFRPTAGGSHIVPMEELPHLKAIIELACAYAADDSPLLTRGEARKSEAKKDRRISRLKRKAKRLKYRLSSAAEREAIHWDARKALKKEKGARENELLDVIARLRRGESPAPVFGEGLISMPDVAPRFESRVKGCPLVDCETKGPHWHGEAQHFDATGKMMPVDETACRDVCCDGANPGVAIGHNAVARERFDTLDGLVTPGFLISEPESDGAS